MGGFIMSEELNEVPVYDEDRSDHYGGIFGQNGEILFFILVFLFLFFNGCFDKK